MKPKPEKSIDNNPEISTSHLISEDNENQINNLSVKQILDIQHKDAKKETEDSNLLEILNSDKETTDKDPQKSPTNVKLLTYNLFLRPPFIKNNSSDHKDFRTKYFIDNIMDKYDIIGLQEVFGLLNGRKEKITSEAKSRNYYCYESEPGSIFGGIDGGLLLISKYPIVERRQYIYKEGVYSDRMSKKGVLYTKIKINESFVNVFLTHTQATYISNPPLSNIGVQKRLKQIDEMRAFIDSMKTLHITSPEPIFLIGDFNVNSRSADEIHSNEYNELRTLLLKEDYKDALFEKYGHHPVTFGDIYNNENSSDTLHLETILTSKSSLGSQESIDYIFHNDHGCKFCDVKVEKFFLENKCVTQLSDHYGISADISLL